MLHMDSVKFGGGSAAQEQSPASSTNNLKLLLGKFGEVPPWYVAFVPVFLLKHCMGQLPGL